MQPLVLSDAPPTLRSLVIDFPDELGPVLSSYIDNHGTPPLLLQLFPLSPEGQSIEAYLLPGEVYPCRLRTSSLKQLEARVSPNVEYMLPSITQWAGASITTLRLSFRSLYYSVSVCLYETNVHFLPMCSNFSYAPAPHLRS